MTSRSHGLSLDHLFYTIVAILNFNQLSEKKNIKNEIAFLKI